MNSVWDPVASTVQFTAPFDVALFCARVPRSAQVLELGCGYGRIAGQLMGLGYSKVRGYDASQVMIERGRAAYPQLCLAVADAAALADADASVDAIVIAGLLTSLPAADQRIAVVAEIGRVLRPGGTVHGVEFLRQADQRYSGEGTFTSKAGIRMHHFQPDELRDLFGNFVEWQASEVDATSLSGARARGLQFVAA